VLEKCVESKSKLYKNKHTVPRPCLVNASYCLHGNSMEMHTDTIG